MKTRAIIALVAGLLSLSSCYTSAKIRQIKKLETQHGSNIIYKYRVGGLQQMLLNISPARMDFGTSIDQFTQEQLSKLRVSIKPLSGPIDVRGIIVNEGDEKIVDLRKGVIKGSLSNNPEIGDIGKYHPVIRFVSIEHSIPPASCDFILTVEDLTGFTKSTGLRVAGGFQDSL